MESIASWLARYGLEQYVASFIANDIDVDVLPSLSEKDLTELGVSMGHRKKILAALLTATSSTAATRAATTSDTLSTSPEITAAGERRQLTVMFCDLVGSTALAEHLDPEDLREVIRAYQQCAGYVITRYDGHIAQYLGDGLLVYFGHPRAHEDDAERAVRAGLAIVSELNERMTRAPFGRDTTLAVRIGIHTGLIVIGDIGDSVRREQLALGDTPNIAARLQGHAEPGTIVISEHTRRLLAGNFVCADMGALAIKGIREPVRACTVTGERESASRFAAATATGISEFVGREEESAHILSRWKLASTGRGQVVLLSGEAGIGKSRVLEEVRQRLGEAGAHAIQMQCSPYHLTSAYYPVARELARTLAFRREEPVEVKLDRLDAFVLRTLGRPAHDAALLASLLSFDAGARYDVPTLPALRHKKESIRALVDLLEARARHAPVVVLFEDAHWSDPTSLEVLEELIGRAASSPMLLIVTYRPEFSPRWLLRPHVTTRALSRLSHEDSAALIVRVTDGKQLSASLVAQIIQKADGVPLFVEELTKFLLESERLQERDGVLYDVAAGDQATIPATLRDSLMARLDRVTQVKELAQIGAAIGREFSYELLGAVAGLPLHELDRALAALIDSGLAVQHRSAPDAAFSFKHALVQDVAYASLLKGRRQELHRTIVGVLEERHPGLRETEPELFARHTSAAGLPELAIVYWRKAAELSLRRMALMEAVGQLSRALELIDALPPSAERDRIELPLHALLGTTHMLGKGWGATEVEAAYRRANELCRSVEHVEETIWPLWGVWVFHHVRGQTSRACDIAEHVESVAIASGDRTARLVAAMMLGQMYSYSAEFDRSVRHLGKARALYLPSQDRALISLYSTDLLLAIEVHESHVRWMQGDPDQATAHYERALENAQSLDHPYSLSWALVWGAMVYLLAGDTATLRARVTRGLSLAREFGFAYTEAIGTLAWGWSEADRGKREHGITEMQRGLIAFRATGAEIVVPFFKTLIAEQMGHVGRVGDGLSLLDEAEAQVEEWGERWQAADIHRTRGVLLASDPSTTPAAIASLERAIHLARAQHARGWELRATLALARVLRAEQRDAEGCARLNAVVQHFDPDTQAREVRDARAHLAARHAG